MLQGLFRKNRKENELEQNDLNHIKEQFEEIKSKKTTRIVTLKYNSCCGCGCMDVDVKREVDEDSHLKDGDRIDKILENDMFD